MKDKTEKKVWGKALAISLAGGLLLSCALSAVRSKGVEAKKTSAATPNKEIIDNDALEDDEAKKNKQKTKKQASESAKSVFATVLIFVASVLVKALTLLGTSVLGKLTGAPIVGVVSFFGDMLANFVAISLLLALLFKRLYPERSLRELFTLKNILWIAGASALISLFRVGLYFVGGKLYFVSVLLQCVLSVGVLVGLYYKTFEVNEGFLGFLGRMFVKDKGKYYLLSTAAFCLFSSIVRVAMRNLALIGVYGEFVVFFVLCLFVSRFALQLLKPKKKVFCREDYYFEIDEKEDRELLTHENI